ncbi:hypothetical protein VTI74DRAFT_11230 [Chaetomium olivicolor]
MRYVYIQFRLRLAGDVWIGPAYRNEDDEYLLSKGSTADTPMTFVHGVCTVNGGVWCNVEVGAFTNGRVTSLKNAGPMIPPFRRPPSSWEYPGPQYHEWDDKDEFVLQTIYGANYTGAPLENVVRIDVFHEPETGFSRGLLLEYANGGQRSVGDCRIGVDSSTRYLRPARLCFRLAKDKVHVSWVAKVECCSKDEEDEYVQLAEEGGWTCFELKGWVRFRSGNGHSHVEVVQDE